MPVTLLRRNNPKKTVLKTSGRKMPSKPVINHVMEVLKTKLQTKNFFESLSRIDFNSKVRKFVFNGKVVAIKNTKGRSYEGADFQKFRKNFLKHQAAVRSGSIKPKHYVLRSIKVHGKIGNYLIMGFVKKIEPWQRYEFGHESYNRALLELRFNLLKVLSSNYKKNITPEIKQLMKFIEDKCLWTNSAGELKFDRANVKLATLLNQLFPKKILNSISQFSDAMTIGNRNPKNHLESKWDIYLPYDAR